MSHLSLVKNPFIKDGQKNTAQCKLKFGFREMFTFKMLGAPQPYCLEWLTLGCI